MAWQIPGTSPWPLNSFSSSARRRSTLNNGAITIEIFGIGPRVLTRSPRGFFRRLRATDSGGANFSKNITRPRLGELFLHAETSSCAWSYLFIFHCFPRRLIGELFEGWTRYAFITSTKVDIGGSTKVAGFDPARCTTARMFPLPLIKYRRNLVPLRFPRLKILSYLLSCFLFFLFLFLLFCFSPFLVDFAWVQFIGGRELSNRGKVCTNQLTLMFKLGTVWFSLLDQWLPRSLNVVSNEQKLWNILLNNFLLLEFVDGVFVLWRKKKM